MYFVSATHLVHKFKHGNFQASEAGPYFMAYMIISAIEWILALQEPNVWDYAGRLASLVITIFGVLYLKEQNGGTFDNDFFNKYFCLGWIVSVRIFLWMIPLAMALVFFEFGSRPDQSRKPMDAIVCAAIEIAHYIWLGALFARTQRKVIRPITTNQRPWPSTATSGSGPGSAVDL